MAKDVVRLDGNTLVLPGDVQVRFVRTLRLPEQGTHALPPGLGDFPVRMVSDYPDTAPAAEAQAWFTQNGLSAAVSALFQLLSVLSLGAFAANLRRAGRVDAKQTRWAFASIGMMVLSCLLSWGMAAFAGSMSADTLGVLRTANFITGGTAHVALLGVFVLLASKAGGFGKGVRVFAWVAFVPAVASVISLVVFQGAALILLGRLLCMIWTLTAAIVVARANRR